MTRPAIPRRHSDLVRALALIPEFSAGLPELEQVATPAEAAAALLEAALANGDLEGRDVVDLGAGTGRLAIGAALLGAASVTAVEVDPGPADVGRRAAGDRAVRVAWEVRDVDGFATPADTVVMNPPFGAQRRHADRPFWTAAFASARRAVYAFALEESRTFIAQRAVERTAHVETTRPVRWELPRVFPHHRRDRMALAVDLWVIRTHGDR
jgi:putative methylase